MGLPQTASSEQSHEASSASSCTLSQSLPLYATSHDSDGLNIGSERGICPSIGEFDRKTSLEPLEFTDDQRGFHGTRVVTTSSSAHGSTSYDADKVSSSLTGARRIVGFTSSETVFVQKINGFLAVLSIAGGDISPKSQKLPFSVTSVGDDCVLLYYASIDLAGGSKSNKFWSQKLKTSQINFDAQSSKSQLRIPMKGRIQLVLSNPEKTQTFLRQKVTLGSSNPPTNEGKSCESGVSTTPHRFR